MWQFKNNSLLKLFQVTSAFFSERVACNDHYRPHHRWFRNYYPLIGGYPIPQVVFSRTGRFLTQLLATPQISAIFTNLWPRGYYCVWGPTCILYMYLHIAIEAKLDRHFLTFHTNKYLSIIGL